MRGIRQSHATIIRSAPIQPRHCQLKLARADVSLDRVSSDDAAESQRESHSHQLDIHQSVSYLLATGSTTATYIENKKNLKQTVTITLQIYVTQSV